jgi:hypothetical protein
MHMLCHSVADFEIAARMLELHQDYSFSRVISRSFFFRYGTGCFLLFHTGKFPQFSHRGLLTTVGYQLGKGMPACYALEVSLNGDEEKLLRATADL